MLDLSRLLICKFKFFRLVNEAAVATEEVYFATEKGQILDVSFRNMTTFRSTPLYSLLGEVETSIGRLGRPNAAVEQARRKHAQAKHTRNASQV